MKHRLLSISFTNRIFYGILLCAISLNTFAQTSGDAGVGITWTLNNGILTISGNGDIADYSLGNPAWTNKPAITTLVINEGVTGIGNGTFLNCKFTSVSIPRTVTKIGWAAFQECDRLTHIIIPSSVTTIGTKAFFMCQGLWYVRVEYTKSLPTIATDAFDEEALHMATLVIPKTTEQLYKGAAVWKEFAEIKEVISFENNLKLKIKVAEGSVYDGTEHRPAVTVTYDGTTLNPGVDYTFTYSNNIKAGIASVTVTGLFFYTDAWPATFNIAPIHFDLEWPKVTLEEGQSLQAAIFTGKDRDKGIFAFSTPEVEPTKEDSDKTLYKLIFIPHDSNYSKDTTMLSVTVIPVTGYNDRLQPEIIIYPNPFVGELHLKGAANYALKVLNVAGSTVYTQKIVADDEVIRLDKLPAGMYFFRLEKDGRTKTIKVGKR
jgi:hypothetical protein